MKRCKRIFSIFIFGLSILILNAVVNPSVSDATVSAMLSESGTTSNGDEIQSIPINLMHNFPGNSTGSSGNLKANPAPQSKSNALVNATPGYEQRRVIQAIKSNYKPLQSTFTAKSTAKPMEVDSTTSAVPLSTKNYTPSTTQSVPPESTPYQKVASEITTFNILLGDTVLIAKFADNPAAKELYDLLSDNQLTIQMRDYGGFEKVGSLGQSLSPNDSNINAGVGDIMLYQGNQLVIFYGYTQWSYTHLGKIEGISSGELKTILGRGNLTVVLSVVDR
jgi:hypothetical protein